MTTIDSIAQADPSSAAGSEPYAEERTVHPDATPTDAAPACPKCAGRMWDNRDSKRNPRAPDFKCRDRSCDGVIWPGQHAEPAPVETWNARQQSEAGSLPPDGEKDPKPAGRGDRPSAGGPGRRAALRQHYLAVTEFVLSEVRSRYRRAGVPLSDAAAAAAAATLFNAERGQ